MALPHSRRVVRRSARIKLLGRLDVQLATFHSGKPSLQQRLACARGAMVLATADHSRALEVLQRR